MKTNIIIESLEARIAPAATVAIDPIKLIATITADPAGDDLTIVQDATGAIDILDNANANTSLTPTGGPELIRGIIYLGGTGDDKTITQLQNGLIDVAGFIKEPSLPEGFIIVENGGANEHTIEAVAEAVTIGKKFQFFGGTGDDTLKLNKVARTKDFFFNGDDGSDTLDLQGSSILGKLLILSLETMTGTDNSVLGATTIDNSKNVFASDISITADLINGAVKYTGSFNDDSLTLTGTVGGAVTFIGKDGTNSFWLSGTAMKVVKFSGGLGDDTFKVTGVALGALTATFGDGLNTAEIIASMAGKAITLTGGAEVDTFSVTAFNAGTLSAKLGAGADDLTTAGSFKALKLDAGLDSGVHNGAEKTLGLTAKSRKNFI